MITLLAAAAITVGANLYSWHSPTDNPDIYSYESVTPGIYARYGDDWFAEAGVYRNSQGNASYHIGGGYLWQANKWLDLSIYAGAVYGYKDWHYQGTGVVYGPSELRPFLVPSVGITVADGWKARVSVIPAVEKDNVYCISFAVERRF